MQQKSTAVCDTEAITIKRLSTKEVPFGAVMFAFIPLKPLTMEKNAKKGIILEWHYYLYGYLCELVPSADGALPFASAASEQT